MDRRKFLKHTAAGATLISLAGVSGAASSAVRGKIRLGAPVFGASDDPEELALAHREVGYRAAYCPRVGLDETDRIRDIRNAFAKHDVAIAEVGCWCNLMDAKEEARRANLDRVTEGLALADAIGARCCVDIAGSFNPDVWYGPHPKNLSEEFFDLAVENARKIIDAVDPKSAKFGYEMMGWALPDTTDSYLRLIEAIDRDAFGVHLDPCNMINSPTLFYENTALLNDVFDRLGPHIVSCHAKDLTWDVEMNVHFREVVLGTGSLDYATYLRRLAELPGDPPLMIEHLSGAEEYARSREYLFEVGQECSVAFE
jgi:sugar phosphate isomerase/epimerase